MSLDCASGSPDRATTAGVATRKFLEIDEFHDLLDAAGEVEADARSDRQGLGRREMCATLGLAGLRISEMLDLLAAQVDLARGRFKLADAGSARSR